MPIWTTKAKGAASRQSSACSSVSSHARHSTTGHPTQHVQTDLSRFSQAHLNKIALRLNQRPRKTLGFETPADKLRAVLHGPIEPTTTNGHCQASFPVTHDVALIYRAVCVSLTA